MTLANWISLALALFGVLSLLAGSVVVVRSSYRKATDKEREEYISALEDRNKLLEATVERQTTEIEKATAKIESVKADYYETQGRMKFLTELVMGRCPRCEIDPKSGGCKFCTFGLLYGKEGNKG
jgi:peptidoglycan hydrolase CwlO-like protein